MKKRHLWNQWKAALIGLLLGRCGAGNFAKSHGLGKRPWWLFFEAGPAWWHNCTPKGHSQSYPPWAQAHLPRIWLLTIKEGSGSDRVGSQTGPDGELRTLETFQPGSIPWLCYLYNRGKVTSSPQAQISSPANWHQEKCQPCKVVGIIKWENAYKEPGK